MYGCFVVVVFYSEEAPLPFTSLLCILKYCYVHVSFVKKKEKKGPVLKCVLLYVCVWVHACVVCVGVGWGGDYEYAVFLLCISVSFIVSSRVLYCCT